MVSDKITQQSLKRLPISEVRSAFKTAESRFILGTGVKFCGICLVTMIMVGYQLYVNARLNFYFFRAHGLEGLAEMRESYFDYVLSNFGDTLPLLFGFLIVLFFLGLYVANMILRPFKNIGRYCEEIVANPDRPYVVEQLAGYRLLTHFSEFFFEHLLDARRKGKLEERPIPPQYTGIHGPVVDWAYLMHFGIFIVIMTVVSVSVIMNVATDIHENTVQLAIKVLKVDPRVMANFFAEQSGILDEMWIITGILVCVLNLLLAFHLYDQVAGAAFGVFATMRSFLKGNYSARVHLVGYSYLRDSTRHFNKYLDWVQKNLTKDAGHS